MNNRKGMVYTTFAIIGTTLLIMLFTFTSTADSYTGEENPFRIGEASYYLENIESDLGRAHGIAAQRAGASVVNYTVRNGEAVENLEPTLRNITINGSTDNFDTVVRNSSLKDWEKTVKKSAQESRYNVEIQYRNLSFEDNYLQLETGLKAFTQLKDPVTSAKFNNTPERTNQIDFTGYEDTMLLIRSEDTYLNTYRKCGFQDPLGNLDNGTGYNGTVTYGSATEDVSAPDPGSKILVNNQPDNGEDFAGVITDDSVSYNSTKYITGVDADTLEVEEGQNLILYQDQIWHSRIRDVIETGCYMRSTTDEPVGPGIQERLKNNLTAAETETQGLETLLDKSRLPEDLQYPDRSNLGYQYFRGQQGQKIAGVTGDQAFDQEREGYRRGFRLDEQHIQEWGIQELAY